MEDTYSCDATDGKIRACHLEKLLQSLNTGSQIIGAE